MSQNTNAGEATEGAPQGGTFTQAQVDELMGKRLSRANAAHEKTQAELQARIAELEKAEGDRKAAAMSELERAVARAAEAEKATLAAQAQAEVAQTDALRYRLVAEKATDLPDMVRRQVTGSKPEEIEASITALRSEWEELRKGMGQPPRSVGSPSAAPGGQPPVPTTGAPQPNAPLSPYEELMAAVAAEDAARKG